jgi:hypothetical protein
MIWQKIWLFIHTTMCFPLLHTHIPLLHYLRPIDIKFYQKQDCPYAKKLIPTLNLISLSYPIITIDVYESNDTFPSPTLRIYQQGAYVNYRGLNECKYAIKTHFFITIVS